MSERLQEKVALVTGAGRGIGEGIAVAMAEQGATVIVADRDRESAAGVVEAITEGGGKATLYAMDVTRESDWVDLEKMIGEKYSRLDILVHNAGIELVAPYETITLEDWRKVQAVNVEALFLGTRVMLQLLKTSGSACDGGASIINISSVAAMIGFPNQAAYNTSKAAVRNLTKSQAIEFAEAGFNIRANSIHPGFIFTPMLQEVFDEWAAKGIRGNDADEILSQFIQMQPLSRMGKPRDIAMGAVYLASEESGFVTGSELVIDGGWLAR